MAALWQSLLPIQHFPQAGALRATLGAGLRAVFHDRDAMCYRPVPTAVMVIRERHGARDTRAVAERGGFEG